MMYWGDHMSTGGWIFSILWTVIIVAILVAGIVWLVSALGHREAYGSASESAREILDRRLARGELSIEQHQQLRAALAEAPPTHGPQPPKPGAAPGDQSRKEAP